MERARRCALATAIVVWGLSASGGWAQNGAEPAAEGNPPRPQSPFQLSAEEQSQLDQVLSTWHQRSSQIQQLECKFNLWEHTVAFNRTVERAGLIAYERPDKGRYWVTYQKAKGPDGQEQWNRVDSEHWVSNGKSIFEFKYPDKTLVEHKLPPELQGAGIRHGPLPFLFVANPQELKGRCWMRLITTEEDAKKGEIWIQALPRYQQDAANFSRAELILKHDSMLPHGVRMFMPDGKSSLTYVFTEYKVNNPGQRPNWLNWAGGRDPWTPPVPNGWQAKEEKALAPASESRNETPSRRPLGGLFGG